MITFSTRCLVEQKVQVIKAKLLSFRFRQNITKYGDNFFYMFSDKGMLSVRISVKEIGNHFGIELTLCYSEDEEDEYSTSFRFDAMDTFTRTVIQFRHRFE